MKKAFTLVEMLIVVAILAVLMGIVFRLSNISGENNRRTSTVVKMQKIENCLSGYYAAFGSYPPVKIHGSRDLYCKVNENGDQDEDLGRNETLNWDQVNAACRSQPFGCEYPGDNDDNDDIEAWMDEIRERVNDSNDYPAYAPGKYSYAELFQSQSKISGPNAGSGFRSQWDNPDWKAIKLFKFGVMSFLLPRYLFMMGGDQTFFSGSDDNGVCAQWGDNNDMPSDPFEGKKFENWTTIQQDAQTNVTGTRNRNQLARVANIPSQAVCARWMPNLDHVCRTLRQHTFFGVAIGNSAGDEVGLGALDDDNPPDPGTHYPPSGKTAYKNAFISIYDGWGHEFYYYSPAPYQSYTVWSAGANGKTFPPWVSIEDLDGNERKTAMDWKNDDIVQMSH